MQTNPRHEANASRRGFVNLKDSMTDMTTKHTITNIRITAARILLAPIKQYLTFFVSMYALGITCVMLIPCNSSRMVGAFQLFTDLYLVCALMLLVPAKARPFAKGIGYVLFYAMAIIDAFCYAHIGNAFCPTFLQQILHTNPRESAEFLSLAKWSDLCSPLGGVVLLLAAHIALHFWRNKPYWLREETLRGRLKAMMALPVAAAVCIGFFSTLDAREYVFLRVVCGLDELKVQSIKDFEPKTRYYLPVYRFAYAISENIQQAAICSELTHSLNKAKVTSCSFSSPHIILIIGESMNKRHSSLYGYDKPTTPCQQRLYDSGRMAVYTDVVSPWNVTCESFQSFMTTHCVGMDGTWASHPLFPQLFRQAGYRTELFSNQYVTNTNSIAAFKEAIFMCNAEYSRAMFDVRNDSLHDYDQGLLADYKRLTGRGNQPCLSIFHFLGLHFDFKQRFPETAQVFKAKDYKRNDLSPADIQVLADYDNAYRYNDSVIAQIVECVEHEDAIVILLSDHGERVFDFNTQEWERTLVWNAANIRQQYEIPFWIYVTETYRSRHPQLWKEICEARHRPFMTDALPHILMHLAGIRSPWYSAPYDVLSDEYNTKRPRILNREREYPF